MRSSLSEWHAPHIIFIFELVRGGLLREQQGKLRWQLRISIYPVRFNLPQRLHGHWYFVQFKLRGRLLREQQGKLHEELTSISSLPQLHTLMRRKDVLGYFICRLSSARTEGFGGKAKLVIGRASGYK